MSTRLLKTLHTTILTLTMGMSMNADAGLFGFGGDSWKEEVLLHDGQKIILQRSQSYGGRHEIGQSSSVKEHSIDFTLPGTNKRITWTSEYGEDLGRTNFNLLAVHVLNGTAYIVVEPNLCLSYNKWGRPNPPYVLLKHDKNAWQRIAMEILPPDFKTLNVVINNSRINDINGAASKTGYVLAEDVGKINSSLRQPEYKTILREAVPTSGGIASCEELVHYKCGWGAPGEFNKKYFERICK